jgi:hypothetical protein
LELLVVAGCIILLLFLLRLFFSIFPKADYSDCLIGGN